MDFPFQRAPVLPQAGFRVQGAARWGPVGRAGSFLVPSSLFAEIQRAQGTHLSNLTADTANLSKPVISNSNLTTKIIKKKRHYLILLRAIFFFLQLCKNPTFDV